VIEIRPGALAAAVLAAQALRFKVYQWERSAYRRFHQHGSTSYLSAKEWPEDEAMVRAACKAARCSAFRDKLITGRERYAVAARLKKICRAAGVFSL